jgi:hydrogenase-4 component F
MNAFIPDGVALVLVIPAATAAILAVTPGYRLSARLNVLSSLLTFVAALSLFVRKPETGPYILVDDLNIVFIVLNTFVAFTTSVFSASYIAHELEIGRLTPIQLRFYHAMYPLLLFGMNLALVANNIGLMWVAIEMATLTTVLMVGIYRTPEAIEAAWKYFILGSVGTRSLCSAPFSSIWRRARSSARGWTGWCRRRSSRMYRPSIPRN